MDVLTPVVTGALLAVFTVVIGLLNKVQFDSVRTQIDGVREDLRAFKTDAATRFEHIELGLDRMDERFGIRLDRMDERFDQMGRDFGALRAEFTQLVLALTPRPQAG